MRDTLLKEYILGQVSTHEDIGRPVREKEGNPLAEIRSEVKGFKDRLYVAVINGVESFFEVNQ